MPLDQTFAALADPTRRAILAQLMDGDATVAELAEPHDLSQPTISKHLKVLEQAGLIATRVEANARPRQLRAEGLAALDEWLGPFRQLWERRLDRLTEFVENPQQKESKK